MSAPVWQDTLREVTSVPGVRGALVISADDGLVVAESAMEDLDTADVAALGAALVARAIGCAAAMGSAPPESVQLVGQDGAVLGMAGPAPLWLVAVAGDVAELGRLRLLLRDLAGALT